MGKFNDRTDKSENPKCNYCGKSDPEKGLTTRDIIHREFDSFLGKQVVATSRFTVCKDTGCGGYLQMAHEG